MLHIFIINMFAQVLSDTFFKRSNAVNQSNGFGGLFSFGSGSVSNITTQRALGLSALFNGVDIISNDIAILPKAIYKKDGASKTKFPEHPVYKALSKKSSKSLNSFWFHKVMTVSAILRGNGLAIINRQKNTGEIDADNAFRFVHPDYIREIKLVDDELWFHTKFGWYHNSEVIHIKGFSLNGYTGVSVLKYAASNLNAALSAEAFAEKNFDSKGVGLGMIKSDKDLDDKGKEALSLGMSKRLGRGGQYNIGVLDEGMSFESIQVSAKEAELIDWKNISVSDIARWLNIGVDKLKQTKDLNYSSMEQASLNHLSDSMQPRISQWENEYDVKLFSTKEDRENLYTKFDVRALLRMDAKTRAEYITKMKYAGIYSGDECRGIEDFNPTGLDYMKDPLQPVQLQQQSQLEKTGKDE